MKQITRHLESQQLGNYSVEIYECESPGEIIYRAVFFGPTTADADLIILNPVGQAQYANLAKLRAELSSLLVKMQVGSQ
jgi:hypothetical protein